ncbi:MULTISPECIES: hypothetical protein [unclassified Nocardioides]|uniref:hypothetical protein n=1 Tax=unclassified Nocardioides TaxID=2615069 RepID=UPI0006F852EA|nr:MULTISPECIES: hypothetical protein [unclassified Nocardioides]KRA37706.1 hypothetical protein ASD81_03125 [Nocardioides sp. Root614]KRA91666.1 hypothetical protein ASD84_03390 [Nocardioides sp. Root682]
MSHGLTDQIAGKVEPTIKRWRRRRKLASMMLAATFGAAAAYFLDPQNGPQRRARARVQLAESNLLGNTALTGDSPFEAAQHTRV